MKLEKFVGTGTQKTGEPFNVYSMKIYYNHKQLIELFKNFMLTKESNFSPI